MLLFNSIFLMQESITIQTGAQIPLSSSLLLEFVSIFIFQTHIKTMMSMFSKNATSRHYFTATMTPIQYEVLLSSILKDDSSTQE